jgi:hypothetical protein
LPIYILKKRRKIRLVNGSIDPIPAPDLCPKDPYLDGLEASESRRSTMHRKPRKHPNAPAKQIGIFPE